MDEFQKKKVVFSLGLVIVSCSLVPPTNACLFVALCSLCWLELLKSMKNANSLTHYSTYFFGF